jgi:urease accessory protein
MRIETRLGLGGSGMASYLKTVMAVAALAILPFAAPALAHHVMGGELPGTAWQGLLSGLGHPIIGLDHLAFTLGVGVMAYLMGAVVVLPLLFVAGTVLGCALHVRGYGLPASELAIAFTIAIAAGIVATRAKVPLALLAAVLVAAGLFHGYAYGESIVGAEPSPLAAYIIGFGAIQSCLAVASAVALRVPVGRNYVSEANAVRLAGGGLALVAAAAFVNAALLG